MIKQKTARAMLYDWHGGQWSATYAAASSGLVKNFEALLLEVRQITFEPDRDKLTEYLLHQQSKNAIDNKNPSNDISPLTYKNTVYRDRYYLALPWAN